jgi:carboxypeptidase C (cathepsin A)
VRRNERLTVGRLDSRFTGIDRDAAAEIYEYDPSYAAIQGSFTATLNDYLRRELGFEIDLPAPYFATQYTFDHLGLDESLRHNISMDFCEAGHMMYIHLSSSKQLKEDLDEFVRSALP